MNDQPADQPEATETQSRSDSRRVGLGTISIMMLFFGIIGAMCLGAAVILAVLLLR